MKIQIAAACMAALVISTGAMAQVGTTVKEGAKATAEKSKEVGDNIKASGQSQPDKTVTKAKAKVHHAKANHHAGEAKDAGKDIPK